MAYKTIPHSFTGYSPYFLAHGREAKKILPTNILNSVTEHRDLSKEDYVQEVITRLKEAFDTTRDNFVKNKEKSK